jgi:Ca2+-binding EF-hand superfamily protein
VARFVKTRRISLTEQFKDKDPMKHRKVSAVAFAQVIQLLGVHISKDEIDLICSFFNDPTTSFVDYPAFVAQVE